MEPVPCAYCDATFDPKGPREAGSFADLGGRARGALFIRDRAAFCDFRCGHPGQPKRGTVDGPCFMTCCGGEEGATWGCVLRVVRHSAKKPDAERDAALAACTYLAPPTPPPPAAPRMEECDFCGTSFDAAEDVPVGGVEQLSGRGGGALRLADPARYCDFVCEHTGAPQPICKYPKAEAALREPRNTLLYACCGATIHSTYGCRCVVVPHSYTAVPDIDLDTYDVTTARAAVYAALKLDPVLDDAALGVIYNAAAAQAKVELTDWFKADYLDPRTRRVRPHPAALARRDAIKQQRAVLLHSVRT